MNKQISLKKIVVAVALTLASSQVVMAQDSSTDKPIEKVIVTGSSLKHIEGETATPVQIIKAEEIRRLGVSSVKQLLDTITSASSTSLSDIGGSNSFASGASAADLRGLGKQSTLILLNSRRVAPYALADYNEVFTNLDSLPLDAVQRVEVLRNGGSSLYGSDAVAGVINIITRSDYEGITANASRDQSVANEQFHKYTASLTGGFGNLVKDRYNVLANVEVFKRGAATWRQVIDDLNPAYGNKFSAVANKSGLMFGNRGTPSTFSYPGNLIGIGPVPGCTTLNAGGLCVYDRFGRFEAQPAAQRVNSLVSGKFDIQENLQAFSEVLFSHTRTDYLPAFTYYDSTASDTVWGDPSTGQAKTFTSRYLPVTHPLNTSGDEVPLRYRFADSGASQTTSSDEYRVLAGLRGTVGKYDWESAVGVMGGKVTADTRGALSDSGFRQEIGNYDPSQTDPLFFNRGYKIGQVNSPAVLNNLFPHYGYEGKITQTFADAKISGEVAQLNGRSVGLAVGGDVRHEKMSILPSANLLAGDIVNNGAATANASRTSSALFTELNVPLTSALEVVGAARVDKFPGFKAHVSPKLAARFEASKQLLFRGTLESGFRAPNLTESAQSSKFSFNPGITDPKRCDQAQVLANDLRASAGKLPDSDTNKALLLARADIVENNECAASVANIVRNNPALKPEVSRSLSFGMVIEPVPGTNLSLDYFNIQRKDEIGLKTTDELLAAEDTLANGVINRLPTAQDKTFSADERAKYGVTAGPLASISGMFENVSKTKTSGIDIGGATRVETRWGRLDLSTNATYLLDLRNFASTLGKYGDNLAGRYTNSKLVANLGGSLKTGDVTNSLRLTYHSATSLQGDYFDNGYTLAGCAAKKWNADECRVASYQRLDYNVSYTGVKDLTVSLFIGNLLGRRPPLDLKGFNKDGGGVIPQDLADVQGRTARVMAEYKFR
ncbi:MAG TPA: TonB-dependent receptor [Burkholderiaceae bacterium]|nr:TonB-dependent receptor [Burkholderiaceae bacterium]